MTSTAKRTPFTARTGHPAGACHRCGVRFDHRRSGLCRSCAKTHVLTVTLPGGETWQPGDAWVLTDSGPVAWSWLGEVPA